MHGQHKTGGKVPLPNQNKKLRNRLVELGLSLSASRQDADNEITSVSNRRRNSLFGPHQDLAFAAPRKILPPVCDHFCRLFENKRKIKIDFRMSMLDDAP